MELPKKTGSMELRAISACFCTRVDLLRNIGAPWGPFWLAFYRNSFSDLACRSGCVFFASSFLYIFKMTLADKTSEGSIFRQFPKHRPPLPNEYSSIYDSEYLANRTAGGFGNCIARALESWMHKKAATSAATQSEIILEIGAGSLNHLPWEEGYASYDVVEPFQKLLGTSSNRGLVRHIYAQLSEIPNESRYDRIISVAVLEHLLDLPMEIARSGLHLQEKGRFCAGVPSEGGWLWKMAWKYGTGPGFTKRTGLDYEKLMRHEHVNTVDEIEECVRYFFNDVTRKRFPLPAKSFSLYSFFIAARPNRKRCEDFLEKTCKQRNPSL